MTKQETYTVERMESATELHAFEQPWTALLADIPDIPVFLTWEWISTWWRHYGKDRTLWLLTVRNEKNDLAGIMPLMLVRHHFGPLQMRFIRFAGSGIVCPCHLGIITRPEDEEAVRTALMAYLQDHRKEWDILDLAGLATESTLKQCKGGSRGRYLERKALLCPYITLPDDWDGYHRTLKKKLRRNLGYFRARLERDHPGQIAFYRVVEAEELTSAFDSLTSMHKQRRTDTSFGDSQFVSFHREMAATALDKGWLRFYQLRVSAQVIAALYCFRYGNVLNAYQTGFDPEWGVYSPGRLLACHAIQEAIEEGAREFDWLQGAGRYKFEWTDNARAESHILLSSNWRGSLGIMGVELMDHAISSDNKMVQRTLVPTIERVIATQAMK